MSTPSPVPTLLHTKLHIPPPRPERVSRPRLIERLNAGRGLKLTLISEDIEDAPLAEQMPIIRPGHRGGDDTDLTFEAEYTVPVPVLGRVAEKVIVKMNQNEAETLLANLKAQIEA